jgi:hypothetical protein
VTGLLDDLHRFAGPACMFAAGDGRRFVLGYSVAARRGRRGRSRVVAGAAVVAGADVGLEELLPELQPTIHADNRRISEAGFQCAKDNHAVCMRRRCAAGRATVASAVGS